MAWTLALWPKPDGIFMEFETADDATLQDVLTWRRDVRHFKTDAIPQDEIDQLRSSMDAAPSVGNARPWRVLQVESADKRAGIIANFEAANAKAATQYKGEKRSEYMALKLAGLRDAPVHLAVFTEKQPVEGHGLGRQTMPEMLDYSTVIAIHTLWLSARALNIGVGWVSILTPGAVADILQVPDNWTLTGYLCVGYPKFQDDTPMLHQKGWQENTQTHWEKV